MRTIDEIIEEAVRNSSNGILSTELIKTCMKEYAIEVLDHLMTNSEDYIYIDTGEDGDYSRPEEAVFNYEAIEQLKQRLK